MALEKDIEKENREKKGIKEKLVPEVKEGIIKNIPKPIEKFNLKEIEKMLEKFLNEKVQLNEEKIKEINNILNKHQIKNNKIPYTAREYSNGWAEWLETTDKGSMIRNYSPISQAPWNRSDKYELNPDKITYHIRKSYKINELNKELEAELIKVLHKK